MKYPKCAPVPEPITRRERLSRWWFGDVVPVLEEIGHYIVSRIPIAILVAWFILVYFLTERGVF